MGGTSRTRQFALMVAKKNQSARRAIDFGWETRRTVRFTGIQRLRQVPEVVRQLKAEHKNFCA